MTANPTSLRATRIGSFSETSFNIAASAIIINIIENHLIDGSDLLQNSGNLCFKNIPKTVGRAVSLKIFTIVLKTGRLNSDPVSKKKNKLAFIINGTVNTVIILLKAVSVIERAVSAFAKWEKRFEVAPPGQQASKINPTDCVGFRPSEIEIKNAMIGKTMICDVSPIRTSLGDFVILLKSSTVRVMPIPNIIRNKSVGNKFAERNSINI